MERVVVLGRGGAGKSTASRRLSSVTGLPLTELDYHFWSTDFVGLEPQVWVAKQAELAAEPRWIMDGDLGPYDVLSPRLRRADTVLVLDFPLWLCAYRAARRGRERLDFWLWVLTWRLTYRQPMLRMITLHATHAKVHVLRSPRQLEQLLSSANGRHHL